MSVAETKNENEYYRMKAAELEADGIAVNQIKNIIDNEKQRYSDIVWLSHDDKERAVAQNKWKALDDLQKEIEKIQK